MRRLSLDYIHKLVLQKPKLEPNRRPKAMPGKKWPTRVAWHIQLADRVLKETPNGPVYILRNRRALNYVGKPSRYRALEAWKFINRANGQTQGTVVEEMWQAEFDRNGLVAYRILGLRTAPEMASGAFFAYHPHSVQAEVVEAFIRPLHLKYIGGMRLYSQKKKLTTEALDAYYNWYKEQFKKALRRPKVAPEMIIGGQVVEPTADNSGTA